MNMKTLLPWLALRWAYVSKVKYALLIIGVIPILFDFLKKITLTPHGLVIPVLGAITYLLWCWCYKYSCPNCVFNFASGIEYAEHCYNNRVKLSLPDEFQLVKNLEIQSLRDHLKPHDYLCPYSKGLQFGEKNLITQYALLEYRLANCSKSLTLRLLMTMLLYSSIISMYFFPLRRVINMLLEVFQWS